MSYKDATPVITVDTGGNYVAPGGGGASGNVGISSVANGVTFPVTDNGGSITVDGAVAVSNFPATQPVSGSVSVSNLPATQPVSGSVSVTNFPATQAVSIASTVNTQETGAATLTTGPTQLATSTTQATLAASLATRKAVIIYNNSTVNLLVAFGATASATVFTTQILPNGTLVVPRETWTGIITGVLPASSAASTANVTVVSP